jgi:hypothetical protein
MASALCEAVVEAKCPQHCGGVEGISVTKGWLVFSILAVIELVLIPSERS